MNTTIENLYNQMVQTDEAFTDATVKEYGKKACDMRYLPEYKQPKHVQDASRAKQEAYAAYRLAAFGR